jgi:hypothetical protein
MGLTKRVNTDKRNTDKNKKRSNYPGNCHFDEWSEEKSASREMTPE